jgi:hypothetical protein
MPLLCVISLNGGWTADPERNKPGRDLAYTRYDKIAEALGCYAEYVEQRERSARPCSAFGARSRKALRLRQRQDRLPRPGGNNAPFQPQDLSGAPASPFRSGVRRRFN